MKKVILIILGLFICLYMFGQQAKTIHSGDWKNDSIWINNIQSKITGNNIVCYIDTLNDVVLNDSIEFGNNCELYVKGRLTINGNLIATNNLKIFVYGELIVNGNMESRNGSAINISGAVNVSGDIVSQNNGTINLTNGTIDIGGDLIGESNCVVIGVGTVNVVGDNSFVICDTCNIVLNASLPIDLLSFTVSCEHHTALLQWSTATETNNSHFLLQRSNDAINFETFATVNGSGNSNQELKYSYIDDDTHAYYRLVQVDYDNTETTFDIVATNCDNVIINVQPNPFSENTTLTVSSDLIGTDIYIHDATGALIEKKTIKDVKTIIEIESTGIYIISFQVGDKILTKKIFKI